MTGRLRGRCILVNRLPAGLAFVFLAAGCGSSSSKGVTILYSGDAQGYLKECACSTGGELGGIARRATLVEQLRKTSPSALLVDAGDFAGGPDPRGALVGWVAAEAMARMKYDAVLPGEVELNLGADFWGKVGGGKVRFVHTNFETPALGPPQHEPLLVEKGGRRIAILGLLGPDLYFLPETKAGLEVEPVVEAAGKALESLRGKKVDLIVALVHLKQPGVDRLAARYPSIRVIVAGHRSVDLEEPERHGSALLVTAGFLGQHLGELTLSGPRLAEADNRVLRIETSLPEDPTIARWVGIATRK